MSASSLPDGDPDREHFLACTGRALEHYQRASRMLPCDDPEVTQLRKQLASIYLHLPPFTSIYLPRLSSVW